MKRVWIVAVVLIVLLCGCKLMDAIRTPEGRNQIGNTMGKVGTGMKVGAGIVAGTPLAPVAPFLAGLGTILGTVGMFLRRTVPGRGVNNIVDDKTVVVKKMGLMDSRKTKLQCIAYVVMGIVMFVTAQYPTAIPKEISALIIAGVAWVTGKNIDGIALEDSAMKSGMNPN